MIQTFRICQRKFAKDALSGIGASINGGRWNSAGIDIVYTSQSLALASMELMVNLPTLSLLKEDYVKIVVQFSEQFIVEPKELPVEWRKYPASPNTAGIGDQWILASQSAVLKVPSAVVDGEWNYLLNPHHHDFDQIIVHQPEPFIFDPRLAKK